MLHHQSGQESSESGGIEKQGEKKRGMGKEEERGRVRERKRKQ